LIRSKTLFAALLTVLIPGLTGCIGVKSHVVQKTVLADHVLDATLDQLLTGMSSRYAAIQTLTATVNVTATTGGEHEGKVDELPTLAGYILLRKPSDLQVLLKVPVLGSVALDMVDDGKTSKLFVPSKKIAIIGSDDVVKPSKKGFENLRPAIIRDAMLVPGIEKDQYVTLTRGSRILKERTKKQEAIEEPDFDLSILGTKQNNELELIRVIHISRVTLLPYQQDMYDHEGRVITIVKYDKYAKYGDIDYPASIFISRPIDEYTLQIDINKLVPNQKLDDEQFTLKFPEGMVVKQM
jgi:outer membrane lipoprotein-sorting protein